MLFIAGDDSRGHMLDLERRTVVRQYNVGMTQEHGVVYCPTQKLVAVHQAQKCTSFLSRHTQQIIHRSFTPEVIHSCAVSACGSLMYAGTATGQLLVWNLSTGELLRSSKLHIRAITCLSLSPDASLLATVSDDSMCKVWQTAPLCSPYPPGEVSAMTEFTGHTLAVTCCVFCHHRPAVLTGSVDRTCRLFDAITGTSVHVLAIGEAVTALALNEEDSLLAIGTRVGRLCFVRLSAPPPADSLATSPMRWFACAEMEMIRREPSLDGHHSPLLFMAFAAHDSSAVYTVSANGKVLLYDATSGELRADCAPYRTGTVRSCCFVEEDKEEADASTPAAPPTRTMGSIRGLHKSAVDPVAGEFHLMASVCLGHASPAVVVSAAPTADSSPARTTGANKIAKRKPKSAPVETESMEERLRRLLRSQEELIQMKAQLQKKLRKLQSR